MEIIARCKLLVTNAEDVEVELTLFSYMDLRQAPPSPDDGRPQTRASLSEVDCVLADICGAPA
jgi:hypothetical protein